MGKVIALANQKGGVGKTTTCVNLAAALSEYQQHVLLIDMDPQGNATVACGIDPHAITHSINDILLDRKELKDVVMTASVGFDVVPSNGDLTEAEVGLLQMSLREHRLLKAISQWRGRYNYILIDCPPSLNMLTVNALVAADTVLIPMQCEYYALEGLTALLNTIENISQAVNPRLHIEGIIRTMFDGRTSLTQQVSEQLFNHFGDSVFKTTIPRNVRLAEAPSYGLPGVIYDRNANGSLAYLSLAKELVEKRSQEISLETEVA